MNRFDSCEILGQLPNIRHAAFTFLVHRTFASRSTSPAQTDDCTCLLYSDDWYFGDTLSGAICSPLSTSYLIAMHIRDTNLYRWGVFRRLANRLGSLDHFLDAMTELVQFSDTEDRKVRRYEIIALTDVNMI
ncbi:uncharacterized protein BJ212DRAFT_1370085 [Suillus subaureus]|uniref:Uncharacterized protein n=1 Tax=Suillus subaureus TaxID=48587 RepID=A0A9P7E6J8_9AGAM|nr:uncharacterized protein BJ212DRAFT_1370085 [Suillus subaureus]KAG1812504.1 hypothetical protein BJ212DRAFT_1370085 [Suillus subaureus]